MPLKIESVMTTAHHLIDGPVVMYAVDANSAVARFPGEWSHVPWVGERRAQALAARKERYDAEVAYAKEHGQPVPAPLAADPLPPTPEEQAAIDAHVQAQAAAAKRLEEFDRKEAERAKIEEQVAADRALVETPAPQPDPNARRPFGRKGEPTPAEKALMDKRAKDKAAADTAAKAKADADAQARAANATVTT